MMRRIFGGESPEIVHERAGHFAAVKADLIRLLSAPYLQGEFQAQGIRGHMVNANKFIQGVAELKKS